MRTIKGPSVNRRGVVAGICATGVFGAYAFAASSNHQTSTTSSTTTTTTTTSTLATSEMDRWTKMVGSEFTGGGYRLKLMGVQAMNSSGVRPPDVTRDSAFVAVFEVLAGGYMPGDLIYRLSTRNQVLDIFLANAFTSQFPRNMNAVFN